MNERTMDQVSGREMVLRAVASALDAAKSADGFGEAAPPLKLATELVLRELLAEQDERTRRSSVAPRTFEAVVQDIEEREARFAFLSKTAVSPSSAAAESMGIKQMLAANVASHCQVAETRFSVNLLSGGRSKATYLVCFEPNGANADMVIRVDKPFGDHATEVAFEYPLMKSLYAAGIPVPEPLWLELGMKDEIGAFMVMRRMPGVQAAGGIFDVAKVSSETLISHAMVLAKLHAASLDIWPDGGGSVGRADAVMTLVDELNDRWREVRTDAPSEITDLAFEWLRSQSALIAGDGMASIVHGDPSFQNTLAIDGRVTCLIDWEFAHAGDPAEDLAYIRDAVERDLPWPQFMAAYRAAGGPEISEARLTYFQPWASLRNMVLASELSAWLKAGGNGDYGAVAIATSTRPRLEALLARHLARARSCAR